MWGGVSDHDFEAIRHYQDSPLRAGEGVGFDDADVTRAQRWREYGICACGAWRGELGLEPTIDMYIEHLVEVFRAVRRVLRDDGTLWLNIGDSFAGSGKGQMGDGTASDRRGAKQGTSKGTTTGGLPVLRPGASAKSTLHGGLGVSDREKIRQPQYPGLSQKLHANNTDGIRPRVGAADGLPNKSLMMIPARLALALQDDGWLLRNDIIWTKSSAMPGSQTDRLTTSYEHIFLFAKPTGIRSKYFFDSYAAHETAKSGFDAFDPKRRSGRMGRDVWQLPGGSFKGSHYAVFPLSLPANTIRLGTSAGGCCADCGTPYRRRTTRRLGGEARVQETKRLAAAARGVSASSLLRSNGRMAVELQTDGFAPDCSHTVRRTRNVGGRTDGFTTPSQPGGLPPVARASDGSDSGCQDHAPTVPCRVLDPFAGSGTTLLAAWQLGRDATGIELSPEYVKIAQDRLREAGAEVDLR